MVNRDGFKYWRYFLCIVVVTEYILKQGERIPHYLEKVGTLNPIHVSVPATVFSTQLYMLVSVCLCESKVLTNIMHSRSQRKTSQITSMFCLRKETLIPFQLSDLVLYSTLVSGVIAMSLFLNFCLLVMRGSRCCSCQSTKLRLPQACVSLVILEHLVFRTKLLWKIELQGEQHVGCLQTLNPEVQPPLLYRTTYPRYLNHRLGKLVACLHLMRSRGREILLMIDDDYSRLSEQASAYGTFMQHVSFWITL